MTDLLAAAAIGAAVWLCWPALRRIETPTEGAPMRRDPYNESDGNAIVGLLNALIILIVLAAFIGLVLYIAG